MGFLNNSVLENEDIGIAKNSTINLQIMSNSNVNIINYQYIINYQEPNKAAVDIERERIKDSLN